MEVLESKEIKAYDGFRAQLAELKADNEKIHFAYETKAGQKEAKSYIYKLRQTKSAVDKARKEEKAASLEYGKRVDSQAKEIIGELEEMIEVHKKPLDEIEAREKARIDKLEAMVGNFEIQEPVPTDSKSLEGIKEVIESMEIGEEFQEFQDRAIKTQAESIRLLNEYISAAKEREEKEEELARLRKEEEERKQKEREDQIRKETEAKVREELQAPQEPKPNEVLHSTRRTPPRSHNPAAINRKVIEALTPIIGDEKIAEKVVGSIAAGLVPNVKIIY